MFFRAVGGDKYDVKASLIERNFFNVYFILECAVRTLILSTYILVKAFPTLLDETTANL